MTRNKTTHEHPSYGMAQFSRSHGTSRRLFGSSLKTHYSTIRLSVTKAKWEHDLHEDRYYGDIDNLIEIEMSSAQFAELITSMNMGGGVPCTIRRFDKKLMADPPDIDTEVERVKANFEADLVGMADTLKERRKEIEKLTEKMPAKSREQMRIALDVMIQQFTMNIPFILEQFNEASDRVVTSAKHEIEAFATHALRTAGLAALVEGGAPKQLSASLDVEMEDEP